jgi:hypothetical protein
MSKPQAGRIYLTDNGAVYCYDHLGASALYTGRDISGQPIEEVTPAVLQEARAMGWEPACEMCGTTASALIHI